MATKKSSVDSEISDQAIPSLQESVISRVNSDQTVFIVNLDLDNMCYSLDGIAAEIWGEIDGKKSLDSIRSKMIEKHNPPEEQFNDDFMSLMAKLSKENLVSF